MYEKYELPIRFTEEQRKKYAEWGIKKGKVLMPMAAVTIGIDLLTVLWVVGRVWLIRESDPIWFQIICQNDGIGEISSTIAIILTFLILKPIDLILDKIWHRPEGTEWLEVGLTENGVTVKRTYRAGDAGTGVDKWTNTWTLRTTRCVSRGFGWKSGKTPGKIFTRPNSRSTGWISRRERAAALTACRNCRRLSKATRQRWRKKKKSGRG